MSIRCSVCVSGVNMIGDCKVSHNNQRNRQPSAANAALVRLQNTRMQDCKVPYDHMMELTDRSVVDVAALMQYQC